MSTASSMADASTSPAANAASPLLARLRAQPRLPAMIGTAALVAALAGFALWSGGPDYKVLYTNVTDHDGGAIIASLQQMNVPYKFAEGGGALLVASDRVPELRMQLAAQGLPKASGVGFELMDNQKFGISQFAERVNYQRALEGELARSIESMATVQSARVHLAIPKPTLFVREQKKPSASVVLALQSGRAIDEDQVSAIVHMVSSSVPELNAKSVTVVDQRGNLLSSARGPGRGLDVSQLRYRQEIEQGYIRRIEAILQPILGSGNVRAQVAADIDFSVIEQTDETFKPNQQPGEAAMRSQQLSESAERGITPPGGVPGALSNQPPVTPSAPINAPEDAKGKTTGKQGAPGSSRKDVTTNYELDRSIRHIQQSTGQLRRLSIAVVVNHKADGSDATAPARSLTPQELEQVHNLVKETVGFNAQRGDSINVVNSAFTDGMRTAAEPEVPFWRDRDNLPLAFTAGRYLLLALAALYFWFALVRPLLRKHLAPPSKAEEERQDPETLAADEGAADEPAEPLDPQAALRQREADRQMQDLDYARETASRDPKLVASMIQNWMNAS